MTDITSLISSIATAAASIIPTIVPGAPNIEKLVETATAIIGAGQQAKALFTGEDTSALDQPLAALVAHMDAHAAAVEQRLGDG